MVHSMTAFLRRWWNEAALGAVEVKLKIYSRTHRGPLRTRGITSRGLGCLLSVCSWVFVGFQAGVAGGLHQRRGRPTVSSAL